MMERKLGIDTHIHSTGILGEFDVEDNDEIRFVVEGAGATNEIIVRLKLQDQASWSDVLTLTSSDEQVLKVDTFEIMQIEVNTIDGTHVKLLASGFEDGC